MTLPSFSFHAALKGKQLSIFDLSLEVAGLALLLGQKPILPINHSLYDFPLPSPFLLQKQILTDQGQEDGKHHCRRAQKNIVVDRGNKGDSDHQG